MLSWINFGILLLKLAQSLISWASAQQQFQAGQDAQIAKTSLEILKTTEQGRKIWDKINAMSDAELGGLFDDLGNPGSGKSGQG